MCIPSVLPLAGGLHSGPSAWGYAAEGTKSELFSAKEGTCGLSMTPTVPHRCLSRPETAL